MGYSILTIIHSQTRTIIQIPSPRQKGNRFNPLPHPPQYKFSDLLNHADRPVNHRLEKALIATAHSLGYDYYYLSYAAWKLGLI